jgi:hypothetical protein
MVVMVAVAACNSGNVTGPGTGTNVDVPGSGVVVTEAREVSGFARVTLHGVGHLVVEQGGAEALTVTADENILPLVTAEVFGGELVLGTLPGQTFASANNIVYTLTVAELEALTVLGAAAAEIRGLDADRFALQVDGAAVVTAAGRADEQDVVLSGVARYDGRGLDSRVVRIDVAGVSGATVRVHDRLEGRVDGQSTVEYIGHPAVDVDVAGGGTVRPIDG